MTSTVETDCVNKLQDPYTFEVTSVNSGGGDAGNLCHIDCANNGLCDYSTGTCNCFVGWTGVDCTVQEALAGAGST